MDAPAPASAPEARRLAEEAREEAWTSPSFLKELFLGRLRFDLVHPFQDVVPERPEWRRFMDELERFLVEVVDPDAIDREGKIPQAVLQGLARMGAFGMKIAAEHGGLGFTQREYAEAIKLVTSRESNLVALLSAHQSIGVPQPLALFGTPEQKARYLPLLARGAVSAFALTEAQVGSDPATLATTATRTPEGDYVLDGEKLWATNGTIADLFVVMARHSDTRKISAFVVEAAWPGVEVVRRCHFMGLRAIENGVIRFRGVKVPKANLLGQEGRGLKIALVTLNTGRLTLPASSAGVAKRVLAICRTWANERVQWGQPIGRHDAIAQILGDMAATTFAVEAVCDVSCALADAGDRDIRLEAAVAKMWTTEETWRLVDQLVQVRGGRGYETADSLKARGEKPVPAERMLRDFRVNLIFEGSSEIMRLFIAREAVDRHLGVAGVLADPQAPLATKLAALPRILAFYAVWYPGRWLPGRSWTGTADLGPLAPHARAAERAARQLALALFHMMVVNGPKLEKRQALLFRAVDVGADLYAMVAALARAQAMRAREDSNAAEAVELADLFCRRMRRRVAHAFAAIRSNDDTTRYGVARRFLNGEYAFLEKGIAREGEELVTEGEAALREIAMALQSGTFPLP